MTQSNPYVTSKNIDVIETIKLAAAVMIFIAAIGGPFILVGSWSNQQKSAISALHKDLSSEMDLMRHNLNARLDAQDVQLRVIRNEVHEIKRSQQLIVDKLITGALEERAAE